MSESSPQDKERPSEGPQTDEDQMRLWKTEPPGPKPGDMQPLQVDSVHDPDSINRPPEGAPTVQIGQ